MNFIETKRVGNKSASSRDERNAIKLDKLQRCYDIVESHEDGNTYDWTSYYTLHYLKEILKYGRGLYRDEQYNTVTAKLFAEVASNMHLSSLFYVMRGVPQYLCDLNVYSDYLNDYFTNNFEESINRRSDNVHHYYIQEIPLYMKVLQHYQKDTMFSDNILQHYLNYIKNTNDFSYSLSWFFITNDTTPEIDEQIIISIINNKDIVAFVEYCNNVFGGKIPIEAYGRNILDYNGLHHRMNKNVDVYSRIMRFVPLDNQLGYSL